MVSPRLTAFQACRRRFLVCLEKNPKGPFLCISFEVLCFYLFLETPNRCETHFHAGRLSNFVLHSQIDPTGDRGDVYLLGLCLVFLCVSPPIYTSLCLLSPPGPRSGRPRAPQRRRWLKAVRASLLWERLIGYRIVDIGYIY